MHKQLINFLMRDGTWGYYWTKPDKHTKWWRVNQGGCPPPPQGDSLDIYFGIHPSTEQRGTKRAIARTIQHVNSLYGDIDVKDFDDREACETHVKSLDPPPSCIVDTGGGYHCYWFLEKPLDPKIAKPLQAAWTSLVGGDPMAKDLVRVLRVPDTLNHKYDPPRPVKIVSIDPDLLYDVNALEALVTDENLIKSSREQLKEPPTLVPTGQRNADIASFAGAMARVGATEETILQASWKRSREQHEPDKDGELLSEQEVRDTVHHAAKYDPDSPLLTMPANDEGNAQCVAMLYGDNFLHCYQTGWLHYNGKFWERNDKPLYRKIVYALTQRRLAARAAGIEKGEPGRAVYAASKQARYNVSNAKKLLESLLPAAWEEFNADPDLLNVSNGVLNLLTGELYPHSPKFKFTYCLETPYDLEADSSVWEKFIQEVLIEEGKEAEPGIIEYVQMALGYTITGYIREEILFFLKGKTRGGKGTLTETLRTLLGKYLSKEVPFHTFSGSRRAGDQNFDLSSLATTRFLAATEPERTESLRAGFIKSITGGNSIQTAFKGKDGFEFRPSFKIWLCSNFEPKLDPSDVAAWSRLRVIRFPNSWLGREDTTLKARLAEPKNLMGLLAWLVRGSVKWGSLQGRGLETPPFVQQAVEAAHAESDYVAQWAKDNLIKCDDMTERITSARLHHHFVEWFVDQGLGSARFARKKQTVTKDLVRLGYAVTKNPFTDSETGKRGRGLRGYKLWREPTLSVLKIDLA